MKVGNQCARVVLLLVLGAWTGSRADYGRAQDTSPVAGSQAPASSAANKTQANPSPVADAEKKNADNKEVSMQDVGTTFRVRVNLVQVHVIVRDQHDNTVDSLKREDFLLYDQGKLQTISSFGIDTASTRRAKAEAAAKTQANAGQQGTGSQASLPERFVAVVFDDTHLTLSDTGPAKVAALKFLADISPNDRVAVYTTSGQLTQEFTSDKVALHKVASGITPRAATNAGTANCPDVTYYMADLIENKGDQQALQVVQKDAEQCRAGGNSPQQSVAMVRVAVQRKLHEGDAENEFAYRQLENILGRLAGMPGERVLLMVSPGFQLSSQYTQETGIIDRANQANIVINTLDARGLYTPESGADISRASGNSIVTAGYDTSYRLAAQSAAAGVLRDFAYGTGGTYFGNSNDLAGGMKLLGATPETSYVLSFSPQNQKTDGRYHTIKVTLADKNNYSIQARNGYYAPKRAKDPEELANQEIEEAALSQEEIGDLPLELHTQYFKTEQAAMLSVVSHLGMSNIHFRNADGRKVDNVTLATVIFDENGNYVTGGEKIVSLNLLNPTYEKMSRLGLTVKSSFEVKPGRYLVRQVVRDSEGAQMAARNGAVEIP
jgi:VWFA-related protein